MKTYKKIVLAAGTGQLGTALQKHFKNNAEEIIILSRSAKKPDGNIRTVQWDAKTIGPWVKELEGADLLINLAGKNVNCRYTEKNKKEIFDSRTNSIEVLAKAIDMLTVQPKVWMQSASATIYRHSEDRAMNEDDGETGEGFSVEVCKKWEGAFLEQSKRFEKIRKVILRISLVLGPDQGVFPRLKNLVKFGLGGKQGNGKQWVSWIHERDICGIVEWIAEHENINGAVNCTSPVPVKNDEFMKIIRKEFGMPIGLPAPAWLLEIGAVIIRTETELILKSRWVLPKRITDSGYKFYFPDVKSAVNNIINSK